MKKRIIAILSLTVILIFTLSLGVTATSSPAHVVDNAELLTSAEHMALESKLSALSDKYKQDIVIVTVYSLDGKGLEAYADDFFDYNGYGYGDTHSGILLFISTQYRDWTISTCGDAVKIFSERDLDSLEGAFLSALSNDNYYDSFNAFADKCEHIIKYDKRLSPMWIIISLIVGAIVSIAVIMIMRSRHKSVKMQTGADTYIISDTFRLERSRDVFLFSTVSRVLKPKSNSRSFGGKRISSSGRRHGGRSGKF